MKKTYFIAVLAFIVSILIAAFLTYTLKLHNNKGSGHYQQHFKADTTQNDTE